MALTQRFFAGRKLTAAQLNEASIPVVSSTADITTPYAGQLIFNTTDKLVYRYTGSAWTPLNAATELEQACTADTTLTTSYADVTGASITFSTPAANSIVIVNANFDLRITVANTGYCYGAVAIDGTRHSRQMLGVYQSVETRANYNLRIKTTLASAGSHTIKLQCKKDNVGTALFTADTTVLGLTVYGA